MSELKAIESATAVIENEHLVYRKSESDKVIAELEEKIKNSRNARKYWRKEYLIEYKQCRHHKYKRCLAMARWCDAEFYKLRRSALKDAFWLRWSERWSAIADKFK